MPLRRLDYNDIFHVANSVYHINTAKTGYRSDVLTVKTVYRNIVLTT